MIIISKNGASSVHHPEHGLVHASPDGTFEVSPELGAELLRFGTQWALPAEHIAERDAVDVADLHDPTAAAEELALLREDVAILRAGGELDTPTADPGPWSPDRRTTAWIGLHLRGDRESIAAWTALTYELYQLQASAAAAKAKATAKATQQTAAEAVDAPGVAA